MGEALKHKDVAKTDDVKDKKGGNERGNWFSRHANKLKLASVLAGALGIGVVAGCGSNEVKCEVVSDDAGVSCSPSDKCVLQMKKKQDAGATDAQTDSGTVTDEPSNNSVDGGTAQDDSYPVCVPKSEVDAAVQDDASTDAPVTQDDAGVQDDAPVQRDDSGAVVCDPQTRNNAQLSVSRNVKLQGVQCGMDSCQGTVGEGETVGMNGSAYTVGAMDDFSLEAAKGTSKLVATRAVSGGSASCSVYEGEVEQGSCYDVLGANVVYQEMEVDNTNAMGRAKVTLSTKSDFTGSETKEFVITDGETKKVTLGTFITATCKLVRGVDGKAYVSVSVTNSDTSATFKAPLGLPLKDDGSSGSVGPVFMKADSASDNVNPACTSVKAVLLVNGQTKSYTDGGSANINGKSYKVVVQAKTDEFGGVDTSKSYVSLVDPTVTQNTDNVVKYGDTKTVNGVSVKFADVGVTLSGGSTETPDGG